MELVSWDIVAEGMNRAFPDNAPPYTVASVQALFRRAMRKLQRLAVRHPAVFDGMLASLEPTLAVIPPIFNRMYASSGHKSFVGHQFNPDENIEDGFDDINFEDVATDLAQEKK